METTQNDHWYVSLQCLQYNCYLEIKSVQPWYIPQCRKSQKIYRKLISNLLFRGHKMRQCWMWGTKLQARYSARPDSLELLSCHGQQLAGQRWRNSKFLTTSCCCSLIFLFPGIVRKFISSTNPQQTWLVASSR